MATKDNTKKQIRRSIVAWAAVAVFVAATISSNIVHAQQSVTVQNAQDLVVQAAKAQIATQKMLKCLPSAVEYGLGIQNLSENTIFKGGINPTNIATGKWFENQIQGNGGDDGEIYCNNKKGAILNYFASTMGVDNWGVYCNVFDGKKTHGIMYPVHGDGQGGDGPDADCTEAGTYRLASMDEATAYIGQLYNNWAATNPYAKSFDSISTYDTATGYMLYRYDLETACGGEYIDDPSGTRVFSTPVKIVNDKGEVEEKYLRSGDKNDDYYSGSSFAADGPTTCGGLINKMNDYADDYQTVILNAWKQECASSEAKSAVAGLIKQYEDKGVSKLTSDEKANYNKLKKAADSGDYTQATDGGGLQCLETADIVITPPETTELPPSKDPNSQNGGGGGDPSDPSQETDPDEEACFKEAGSMGWVICPIIKGGGKVISDIYAKWIEPMLMVHDSVVADIAKDNGAIYQGWTVFRNIANIAFVVYFLVIIFSQLTGFGIDNYGIKKALPKLIVTAILVNLSFIICAVAVDISNVIGGGIDDLLTTTANNAITNGEFYSGISGQSGPEIVSSTGANVLKLIAAAGAAGGAAVGIIALGGWTVVIPILIFVVTAIISAFFGFIILAARQAIIIILIVISPLAFVMYALPNTQSIFQKWLNVFKGMLMVYPVTGALIGGGYFASRVMLASSSTDDFLMSLVGALLCVIPYFAIPSLTQKSMDAIGGIAGRIANIGNRLGGAAGRGIQNSDFAQNRMAESQSRINARRHQRQAIRAQKYLDRHKDAATKMANGEKVSNFTRRRMTNAALVANTGADEAARGQSAILRNQTLNSDEGRRAAARSAVDQAQAEDLANTSALLNGGDMTKMAYNSETGQYEASADNGTIDSNDVDELGDQLEMALKAEKSDANDRRIKALTDKLNATGGHKGRDRVTKAVENATNSGEARRGNIGTLSQHMMDKHQDIAKKQGMDKYYNDNYNAGKDPRNVNTTISTSDPSDAGLVADQASQVMRNADTGIKAEDISNMDDNALAGFASGVQSMAEGDDRDAVTAAAGRLMESALNGDVDTSGWSQDKLNSIAQVAGYKDYETATQQMGGTNIEIQPAITGPGIVPEKRSFNFNNMPVNAQDVAVATKNSKGEVIFKLKNGDTYNVATKDYTPNTPPGTP